MGSFNQVPAVKDDTRERPVPSLWRSRFERIIESFVSGDYSISRGIQGVEEVPKDTATQVSEYIADYGEVLAPLTEDTWDTSVSIWMGSHWDVIVDFQTEAEGRSDMVLSARVTEAGDEHSIEIEMVYVP